MTNKTCNIDIPMSEVHAMWWLFERWCVRKYGEDFHKHLHGIKCIYQIRKFQSRNVDNPLNIRIIDKIGDDDDGDKSILVLIPHPTLGVTVIFVPEVSEAKNIFILYPATMRELQTNLAEMEKLISKEE